MFRNFSGRFISRVAIGLLCLGLSATVVAADATKKTVEAVYMEKSKLKGKQVSVRGKVVKVNNGIMKRNFLHTFRKPESIICHIYGIISTCIWS